MLKQLQYLLIAATTLLLADVSIAQDSQHWEVSIIPYLWAPSITTRIAVDDKDTSIHLSQSDVFDDLQSAYMAYIMVRRGKFGFANETVYMDLENTTNKTYVSGDITTTGTMKEGISDFVVQYKPSDFSNTTLYAGARYIWLDTKINRVAKTTVDVANDESWTLPVIGVFEVIPIKDHFQAMLRADYAIGKGGEYSSVLGATLMYDLSELMKLYIGYRYSALKHDSGGIDLNQTFQGGALGLGFHF